MRFKNQKVALKDTKYQLKTVHVMIMLSELAFSLDTATATFELPNPIVLQQLKTITNPFLTVKNLITTTLLVLTASIVSSQDLSNNTFGKGLKLMTRDSTFSIQFRFRFQTRYDGELNLETKDYNDALLVRRSRIKFDGHAYSPKLIYKVELAIANSDTRTGSVPQSGRTANIVLDAVLKYNFAQNWSLWFGQTKLPGNRERVISSQLLQFVDRSNLNSRFNIDRDLGFQLRYSPGKFNLIGAMSMGEGRNMTQDNVGGYDYTGRIEYLPFGQFKSDGDYFCSDLKREKKPKLSLAVTYDQNNGSSRSGGQLGEFFSEQRDLQTFFVDAHFKYKGLSSLIEYANKTSDSDPTFTDSNNDFKAFYVGDAISAQAGYLFKNNFEIAGRYTKVNPEKITLRNENTQYTLGVSKYFVGHSLKIQSDLSIIREPNIDDMLVWRFQVEFAF